MRTNLLARTILPALAALALLSGCNGGPSAKTFVWKNDGQRLRIAVLPFDNVSVNQDAGRILTSTVVTYLLSTGEFDVVEPGVIYSTLASEGVRLTEGLSLEDCRKLQPKLNADAFVIGLVEEFGEVRIGSDSYPSVSFSARLVDARTADILWAASISKTGADSVKIFDIGRVSSLGKLARRAVGDMAASLYRSKDPVVAALAASSEQRPAVAATGDTHGPATSTAPATGSRSDGSATYGEKELTASLKDIGPIKVGAITYKRHFHDTVETRYQLSDGKFVEVKLVDYRKPDISEKFLRHYHPGEQPRKLESFTAFANDSDFGEHHLDIAVGQFGLFLRGPKDRKSDIESLGSSIIALLK
ncbi:MAG: hypothetical protein A2Z18_00295 [Armatimonadetes bacterium RBG_16_58_9]|nr:MAG: hypothetical protein A2Z18_00295 [Armatimonadetes bacterium RBG_16_58_9]